jgi:purine-nucleoside phosphorylase
MQKEIQQVAEAVATIRTHSELQPEIGLFVGTGLGASVAGLEVRAGLDHHQIPNFPISTVEGHSGRLLLGTMGPRAVMVMQGRVHLYEGYTPRQVAFPIRVMQAMGVKTLLVTNAAGGLNDAFSPGDIMIITDHINLTGDNPLVGANADQWGVRFPDMSRVYARGLAQLAATTALSGGLHLQKGVYAGLKGPSLETPAEIRFLRAIGADAVGLSTVMEVIAAVHAGMRILGLSIITNVHDPDRPQPATLDEIIATARDCAPRLERVLGGVIAGC